MSSPLPFQQKAPVLVSQQMAVETLKWAKALGDGAAYSREGVIHLLWSYCVAMDALLVGTPEAKEACLKAANWKYLVEPEVP